MCFNKYMNEYLFIHLNIYIFVYIFVNTFKYLFMGKSMKGIFVAFENPKGGSGKSTLTALFAGYLHTVGKEKGLTAGVIDIDDMQNSVNKLRNFEADNAQSEEEYEIMSISSEEVVKHIDYLRAAFDIILIDFPGNLKQKGVIDTLHLIDIIIIPFETNQISIMATLEFFNIYKDILNARNKLELKTIVKGLPNRVNANLKEYKQLIMEQDNLPFDLMKNHVKESKVDFQRNLTTLIKSYQNNCDLVCEEILDLIMQYSN